MWYTDCEKTELSERQSSTYLSDDVAMASSSDMLAFQPVLNVFNPLVGSCSLVTDVHYSSSLSFLVAAESLS